MCIRDSARSVPRLASGLHGGDEDLLGECRADRAYRLADTERDRSAKWRAGQHLNAATRNDPDLGEIAKLVGVAVADALNAHARADLHVVQHGELAFAERSVARGNWRAVGVGRGLADRLSHSIDQFVGRGVLEPFGFLVDPIPRITQRGREVGLDHAVPALSLIHISEPTRLLSISYAVF